MQEASQSFSSGVTAELQMTDSSSILCPQCSAQMPGTAAFCPGCGQPVSSVPQGDGVVGLFHENIAGGLAYFTFVPAVLFLSILPYKRNRFVRFHAAQCVLLWCAIAIAVVALRLMVGLLLWIPLVGPLLVTLMWVVAGLAAFVLWLVLVIKALQAELFSLPILGSFAERYATYV
jgi:uncharacterized membrane protein